MYIAHVDIQSAFRSLLQLWLLEWKRLEQGSWRRSLARANAICYQKNLESLCTVSLHGPEGLLASATVQQKGSKPLRH